MRELITEGTICLRDDYGIEYKIAKITYTETEEGNFKYLFQPYYEVINILTPDLFQGIPGLDLSTRKKVFERINMIPTFISERTPGKNRENLWEMLNAVGMTYLNQLEWLIRTDTRYSGDRLYVKRYSPDDEKKILRIDSNWKKAINACRDILDRICYGNDVIGDGYEINDTNRKDIYNLLYHMYGNEMNQRRETLTRGIRNGAAQGHYKGRKRIKVSTPKLSEISDALISHRITEAQALDMLGISRATLYRRLKDFRAKKGDHS